MLVEPHDSMSSNDGEPIKSEELIAKLKSALEKRSEITEINKDEKADFRILVKGHSEPLLVSIQTQVNKIPEIGYYELYVFSGNSDVTQAKKFFIHSDKSVENAVASFFSSFNKKK